MHFIKFDAIYKLCIIFKIYAFFAFGRLGFASLGLGMGNASAVMRIN